MLESLIFYPLTPTSITLSEYFQLHDLNNAIPLHHNTTIPPPCLPYPLPKTYHPPLYAHPTLTQSPKSTKSIPPSPPGLTLQISSYLPLPTRICLALTCKSLYTFFTPALQAPELQSPRLPLLGQSMIAREYLCTRAYKARMVLLELLEDVRWGCCAVCMKLHRRGEFGVAGFGGIGDWG